MKPFYRVKFNASTYSTWPKERIQIKVVSTTGLLLINSLKAYQMGQIGIVNSIEPMQ